VITRSVVAKVFGDHLGLGAVDESASTINREAIDADEPLMVVRG